MATARRGSGNGWTARSGAIGLTCAWILLTAPGRVQAAAPTLAVTAIDYLDTSAEPRNQTADHARRLKLFADSLRADLSASGGFRIAALVARLRRARRRPAIRLP